MKVREWIERLSEMDPEWDVCATKDGDPQKKMHPVMPVEAQDISNKSGVAQHHCAPYVRVVKEGIEL